MMAGTVAVNSLESLSRRAVLNMRNPNGKRLGKYIEDLLRELPRHHPGRLLNWVISIGRCRIA
jgi:hypothetical protein